MPCTLQSRLQREPAGWMRRPARGLVLLLFSGLMLLGCGGGKKSAPPAVAKITLTPPSGSVNQGDTLQFFAQALDAGGRQVSNVTISFSSSNTSVATVSKGGLLCAGTWDANFVVCTPGAVGSAQITASGGGVTSGAVTVFAHQKVTSVTLAPMNVNCVSVGSTQLFTATALSGGTDITSTVGTFAFTSNNASVVTVDSNGLATAKTPGGAGIFATVSGVNSATSNFVTCPPKSISLVTGSTTTPFSFTLSSGGTQQLTATVIDTQGNMLSGLALTYVSLNPVSLAVSSTGLASPTSPVAPGSGAIVAACTPPNCNSGLYPVYSNAVLGTVSGNGNPTTVYASSSIAPTSGSSQLVPIDTGTNTAGTAINLPNLPNSLVFNLQGNKAYLGSDSSLMILDAVAGTVTPNTNLKGKVLAVSPNGNKVIVSDAAGGKLYAFDTSSAGGIETFNVAGATGAAFAPDSFKAYVVAGSNLYVYVPGRILRPTALSTAAADVAFLPSGAFAYLAGGASSAITTRATCDDSLADTVALPATPLLVGAAPDASQVLAVDNSAIDSIVVTVNPTGCPPGVTDFPRAAHGFAQGAFTPQQLILTPDAKHAYVTSNLGVLLAYDVTAGVTSTIALSGGATQTFTGGATLDSKNVYVGVAAGANGVHRIDAATGADATAIPTPFLPNLVAVRPK